MGAIGSAGLHNRSRVQVVGPHAIDDEPGLLSQLFELAGGQLDHQSVYMASNQCVILTKKGIQASYLAGCGPG